MSHPPVIALCGAIGSGKTTVAKMLEDHGYERSSLANPLKEMLQSLGVPMKSLFGTPEEKARVLVTFSGQSGRSLMQSLGSWGRQQHADFWLRIWASDAPAKAVVDDTRYTNEFDFVKSVGGVIIKVERPNTTNLIGIADHESERDWKNQRFDAVIENSGDLLALETEVMRVLKCVSVEGRHVVTSGAQA